MQNQTPPPFSLRPVLARRRWLALAIFALALTASAGAAVFLPDVYRATATVIVQREEVPEAFVRSAVTTELETRIQSVTQELLSRSRLEALIDRFGLYPEIRAAAPLEAAVTRMRRDITIAPVASTALRPQATAFTLSYRGTDPETVATVTNTLATSYVDGNLEIRAGQARGTAQLLKAQLDEVKLRLDQQDRQTSTLRRNFSDELPEQTTANLASLERLNADLRFNNDKQQRAIDRRDTLLAEQSSALEAASESPSGTGVVGSAVARRRTELLSELAQLRARFGDQHPDVRLAEVELARLGTETSPVETRARAITRPPPDPRTRAALTAAELELERLEREEASLRGQILIYERRVQAAPQRAQALKDTSRDYATTVDLYDSLMKRYEDALLSENMETRKSGEQFRILDAALTPTAPAAPDRVQLLLLALGFSIALAAAAVLLAEKLDSSFHSLDDLRAFTAVPVLGTIPPIVTARDRRRRRWRFALAGAGAVCAIVLILFGTQQLTESNVALVRLLARGSL